MTKEKIAENDDFMRQAAAKHLNVHAVGTDGKEYTGKASFYCKADDEEDGYATFCIDFDDSDDGIIIASNELKEVTEA